MAISNRAREQLNQFAEEAVVSASLAAAPWDHAQLSASRLEVPAGETTTVTWIVPAGPVPAFLRIGSHGVWQPVNHRGNQTLRIEIEDIEITLRVGPRVARKLAIRAVLPRPGLELFPDKDYLVTTGAAMRVEWYASHSKHTRVRCNGEPWYDAPTIGAIDIARVLSANTVEVSVTGWDGTTLTHCVSINTESAIGPARCAFEERMRQRDFKLRQAWRNA